MPESEEWPEGRPESSEHPRARRTGSAAAAARMRQQHTWVDLQVQQAMERGDFDDLPGAGKPIKDLGAHHDPDWWVKQLVEREKIAVLPPSLALRKEDAELDDRLDAINYEAEVRRVVEDFNERVIRARYSLHGGPPLITMPRDVDDTVAAWAARRAAHAAQRVPRTGPADAPRRRHWWNRRSRRGEGSS
ncbi:DUF1992 domain-containing protein [Nocardioides sp. YIM 152315]|uniref:DnaJ family domain-containing protein n=1 Tax=Nocardioides sp. YIM 152315 TaxID=3031760 RepID=UPI0023DBBC54|nr:DUF1992 domain-containing protein [Nocardioides sp. YIM 152315]MDF1602267.1 DUF1992 domain-containing protein [Nocardioides sp. YIM 152315]